MFARISTAMLPAIVAALVALDGAKSGNDGNDPYGAHREWADAFQTRVQARLCERVFVPSREEAEERIVQAIAQLAQELQLSFDTVADALGKLSEHGGRGGVATSAWGPALERELTRRQVQLLNTLLALRREHSAASVVEHAQRRTRTIGSLATKWRQQEVKDEARLMQLERVQRERALRGLARKYAVNWLLGGHPDSYVPLEWTAVARRSSLPTGRGPLAHVSREDDMQEFQEMRALIKQLTDELVAVGLGDYSPEYVVQVERHLDGQRPQIQTFLADLTGLQLGEEPVRLANR